MSPTRPQDAGRAARDLAIGVLGLQGDVREHCEMLHGLGATAIAVKRPADLADIQAIILPGGESTTLGMLLVSSGLAEPLRERLAGGLPALGTCAGMILLASTVLDGRADQRPLGAIDIVVRRNAFGRQRASFEADLAVELLGGEPMHGVFIRAPVVEQVGPGVRVLASVRGADGESRPVVCREARITVAAFHPELSGDDRLHAMLLADAAACS